MTKITQAQARWIQLLRKDATQHLVFWALVLAVVLCFFAIHAWYQGKVELLDTVYYRREAFWRVFGEGMLYTLMLGIPVYVNLIFVYQGRVQRFLERRVFTRAQFGGWGFHLFIGFSFITALFFALLYAPIIRAFFELSEQKWYEHSIIILFMIICTTGVSFSKEAIERSRELERRSQQEAIQRGKELEQKLDFIKKQIRPHFLFNTLANLQALARRKSDNLPELIGELSRLLRHLVYETNERLAPLEDELHFIESYVKLQRLQISRHTELVLEVEGAPQPRHRIAPMVLLLLVENCFKHYNSKGAGKKLISLHFCIADDELHATLRNTYKPYARNEGMLDDKPEGGLGLSTAVENLELVYDGRYRLDLRQDGRIFTVQLQVPLL